MVVIVILSLSLSFSLSFSLSLSLSLSLSHMFSFPLPFPSPFIQSPFYPTVSFLIRPQHSCAISFPSLSSSLSPSSHLHFLVSSPVPHLYPLHHSHLSNFPHLISTFLPLSSPLSVYSFSLLQLFLLFSFILSHSRV